MAPRIPGREKKRVPLKCLRSLWVNSLTAYPKCKSMLASWNTSSLTKNLLTSRSSAPPPRTTQFRMTAQACRHSMSWFKSSLPLKMSWIWPQMKKWVACRSLKTNTSFKFNWSVSCYKRWTRLFLLSTRNHLSMLTIMKDKCWFSSSTRLVTTSSKLFNRKYRSRNRLSLNFIMRSPNNKTIKRLKAKQIN